jgi:hypothetical protein
MTPQEEDDALIREHDVKEQHETDDRPSIDTPDSPVEEAAHREQERIAMYGSLRSSDPQYFSSSLGEDEDPKSSLESENEPS